MECFVFFPLVLFSRKQLDIGWKCGRVPDEWEKAGWDTGGWHNALPMYETYLWWLTLLFIGWGLG